MSDETERNPWEPARLIPVAGIRNAEEQEKRATSALLAVLSAVEEFGQAIAGTFGAPKAKLKSYIEVPFELSSGREVRPDGVLRATRGKKTWTALVEVKTGTNALSREQVESYLDLAKEQGFDCVITISNQIAKIPGEHPVEVDGRKLRRTSLYHLSWSKVLTEAVMQKTYRGVADADQAWILGELIRYLEHPKAGSADFADMGEHWVGVRDAVKDRTLRKTDRKALEVAGKWEELVSYAALSLRRKLGADVQEVLSLKERNDIRVRIDNIVDAMVNKGIMPGTIRIPDTVGDIDLKADLRAQQIIASVTFDAPKTGRASTRINWLVRQLKVSSPDVCLDSWGLRARSSMSELLEKVRQKPDLLVPPDNRDIVAFSVSLTRPMGMKRSSTKGSFIDSVLQMVNDFYGDVVEHLQAWQPPAPKLKKTEAESDETPSLPRGDAKPRPVALDGPDEE